MRLTKRGHYLLDALLVVVGVLGGIYLLHVTRYLPETAFLFLLVVFLVGLFWVRKQIR
jgi:hypothetical protein